MARFRAEAEDGLMQEVTLENAQRVYGDRLTIAALGAVEKGGWQRRLPRHLRRHARRTDESTDPRARPPEVPHRR